MGIAEPAAMNAPKEPADPKTDPAPAAPKANKVMIALVAGNLLVTAGLGGFIVTRPAQDAAGQHSEEKGEKAEDDKSPTEHDEGTDPAEGDKAEGEQKEGEKKEGDKAEGEKKEGDKAEGDKKEGEKKEGEKKEGEKKEGEKKAGAAEGAPKEGVGASTTARLDDIIVRLRNPEIDRYARLTLDVEMADPGDLGQLTLRSPHIRDAVITALSEKTFEDLRGAEGLGRMKALLRERIDEVVPGEVSAIYISGFIVQ